MLQRQLLLVSLMVLPAMSKTMELGRSGRPTMDEDDDGRRRLVGRRRSDLGGHRTGSSINDGQIAQH
jgi:hypothetical protein